MRRLLAFPLLWPAIALSFILTLLLYYDTDRSSPYRFEVKLTSTARGHTRLYFDADEGFSEALPAAQLIEAGATVQRCRFKIPLGTYRHFRLMPIDTGATVVIAEARIVTKHNAVIRSFSPDNFSSGQGIHEIKKIANSGLKIVTGAGSARPTLDIDLTTPLILGPRNQLPRLAWRFIMVFPICLALVSLGGMAVRKMNRTLSMWIVRIRGYFGPRPKRAVAAVALFAIMLNCYPVIFLGRSFVSPNFGTDLLYAWFPTLPGYHSTVMEGTQGSDVGAMIWQDVPYSVLQHRALFHDHELPLWNRYASGGNALLGQGQSMFGDPLHMLVIAANGAAWAWDLKFIAAKWLFAFCLGLIVLHGTRHLPSAVLTAFSAPFIGFFLYRLNHPAYFSFCYAPWILYSWVRLTDAPTARQTAMWCGVLLFSCWTEMNSGTVKEAYMQLFLMNFMGLVVLAFGRIGWKAKVGKFFAAVWTGGLFMLISSPIWLTLLETLKNSFSDYENSNRVFLLHPSLLLGLFDEIFYRPLTESDHVFNPSANFLVLCGVLYAVATFRHTAPNRLKLALAVSVAALMAAVYGVIPPAWIVKVPFLGAVQHVYDCVAMNLVIGLIALAGFGFQAASDRLGRPEGRGDLLVAGLLLAALLTFYVASTRQLLFSDQIVYSTMMHTPISPVVWGSLFALPAAGLVLALVFRSARIRGRWSSFQVLVAVECLLVLLWRFGLQAHFEGFDDFVFNPEVRTDFHARSAAIDAVRRDRGQPFRVIGFEDNLFPGWSAVYGLEGLSGPDGFMSQDYRELLDAFGLDRQWSWRIVAHVATTATLRPYYDFLNVKYFFDQPTDHSPLHNVLRLATRADLDVYASDTCWPRAFFTDRLATYNTAAELAQLVGKDGGRPFAAVLPADRAQAPALPSNLAGRMVIPANHYRLTTNTTSFNVTASGPGVIILQECWMKDDFRVQVNGHSAEYFRVNHAFKGVAVDKAGTYQVTFTYWPCHFTLALILCGVGCVLLAASWAAAWWMDRSGLATLKSSA